MPVKAAVTVAAVAEVKTAAEGAAVTFALTALAMMGAGNGGGRQQSTKKW
jgi:hypothetical protein